MRLVTDCRFAIVLGGFLASAGPFNKGNAYSEHTLRLPRHPGHRFLLRLYNEATVWFYIEKLESE